MNLLNTWIDQITKSTYKKNLRHCKSSVAGYRTLVFAIALITLSIFPTYKALSQRNMEYLTRGLVAVNTSDYVFVSWRIFATDGDSVQFNLYRDGAKITDTPLSDISNYSDSSGTKSSMYYLETVFTSGRTEISTPVAVWEKEYKTIDMQLPASNYYPNDASIGDINGDGELEIIVKVQMANPDNTGSGSKLDPVFLQAYKLNGTMMWEINLGVNIRPGSHYTQFMVYDLDNDGIAEIACKTAPGTMDGTGTYLSTGPAATDDDAADYRTSDGMVLSGPEYLTVFNGLTGAEIATVDYIVPRGNINNWGDGYGNRVDRFLAAVAYLDGVHPSLVMCRGYYTRTVLAAWDFDGSSLTSRWVFDTDEAFSSYAGQGNHNLSVADGDNDGKDEIYYGAMAVDDDGTGLWNTGYGHGDAMHVSDIDPETPGLEKWGVFEGAGKPGSALLSADSGKVLWKTPNTDADIGRGVTADVSADFLGMECWGGTDGLRSCKDEYVGRSPSSANFVIWWDDDLVRELLDGVSISKYDPNAVIDPRIMTARGCMSNNGTKSVPNLSGDIFGDWREELILRTEDNTQLRIYTTTTPTDYGIYTLLQDPQYRLALVWQNVGYNQPPHPGYYLGDGMDMNAIPVPDINVREADKSSINITSPVDNYELGLGLDLNIAVHATALSGTNDDIVIWQDGVAVDTILDAPHYSTIEGLTTGAYTFYATALGSDENSITSDTIHITVDEGDPHVEITTPYTGDTYLPSEAISISADAWDTDGNIDSVVFMINDSSVGTFTSEPYAIEIGSPGIGVHELTAIAYDNDVKSTVSETVEISVGYQRLIEENDRGFCYFANGAGWIESNNVGYSGDGFANTENIPGVQVLYNIDFPETGNYKFEIRYACSAARPGKLLIDDSEIANIAFISTVDYNTYYTIAIDAETPAGIHQIAIEAAHDDGLPNIDYLRIYSLEANEAVTGSYCDTIYPDNASLWELSVAGLDLYPEFDSAIYNYSIVLPLDVTELNISAEATDTLATVDYDTLVAVSPAPGTIEIVVTSRDSSNTITYTISYDYTSVNNITTNDLKIYPVPAQDHINIRMGNSSELIQNIALWSMEGRKVLSSIDINTSLSSLDMTDIPNGMYIIQVNTNECTYSKKITVSNR